MSELIASIAVILSNASNTHIRPQLVFRAENTLDDKDNLDVYGVTILHSDGRYIVYLHAPSKGNILVKQVHISADDLAHLRVWQTGNITHVNQHRVTW